jgi:hypothetical protein
MRLARVLWIAVAVATAACGNGSSSTPISPGNVVLEVTALLPRNDEVWLAPRDPDPVSGDEGYPGDPEPVTIGCDLKLGVQVDVQNFSLRPPGSCSGTPQCGYLVIELDPDQGPAAHAESATSSVLLTLSDPLAASDALAGSHVLRPRLLLDDGTKFTEPFAFTPKDVSVTFAADSCENEPDGAGGSGSDGGAGGASNP